MRLRNLVDPLGVAPWAASLAGRATRATFERVADELLDDGTVDRLLDRAVKRGVVDHAVDRVLATPLPEHVAAQLLSGGVAERVAAQVLAAPELDAVVTTALDSPRVVEIAQLVIESEALAKIVAEVFDSRLLDDSVARALASEQLWLVVQEVAQSPAVTEAIGQQGAGLADQVAEDVGRRSRQADVRLERTARRFLRRPARVLPAEDADEVGTPRLAGR